MVWNWKQLQLSLDVSEVGYMSDDLILRETLSALVDGEANELEVQRLLKQPLSTDSLARLRRYQAVRAVLAGDGAVATIDVSGAVAAALQHEQPLHHTSVAEGSLAHQSAASEQPHHRQAASQAVHSKGRWQLFGGAAVAASVAFGVIFSAQLFRQAPQDGAVEVAASLPAQASLQGQGLVQGQPSLVQSQQVDLRVPVTASLEQRAVSEEHRRRLNEYLMRHAEHAALNGGQSVAPFARLAGFETSQPPQR